MGAARVFYAQFLDTDLLEIAPQGGGDSQAVVNTENPVRDAAECNVCHYIVDPVAGAFQNVDKTGNWGPLSGGWYTDSFAPGLEGDVMPASEYDRALQWLGARTVQDKRFRRAMVSNVYEAIMGRRPLAMPKNAERPEYLGLLRAYNAQQNWLREVERQFVASDYTIKEVIKQIVTSPYYRAQGASIDLESAAPQERGAYAELGLARLLTPEQLDRKIEAIFGERWMSTDPWNILTDPRVFYMLYAGIDSKTILERLRYMSPMMASIATIMAGDVSCRLALKDFGRPNADRRLFRGIDLSSPSASLEPKQVRATIAQLHDLILGLPVTEDSVEVDIFYELFIAVQRDGAQAIARGQEPEDVRSHCGGFNDPHYTARAWMAVVTAMLEDWTFLFH